MAIQSLKHILLQKKGFSYAILQDLQNIETLRKKSSKICIMSRKCTSFKKEQPFIQNRLHSRFSTFWNQNKRVYSAVCDNNSKIELIWTNVILSRMQQKKFPTFPIIFLCQDLEQPCLLFTVIISQQQNQQDRSKGGRTLWRLRSLHGCQGGWWNLSKLSIRWVMVALRLLMVT